MDAKAQEEAERERKREAIRQRISAAKAASNVATSDDPKSEKESSKDPKVTSKASEIEIESTSKQKDKACEETALTSAVNDPSASVAPDCYDFDPSSYPTLPLPTKEAGSSQQFSAQLCRNG